MRILGLDIGDRTIGVAISDPLGWTAQGIKTIKRTSEARDLEELKNMCAEYKVDKIVSGLPKNMNGTLGPQSEKVIEFCDLLKEEVNIEIVMWDERLTTVAAHRAMLEADLDRKSTRLNSSHANISY